MYPNHKENPAPLQIIGTIAPWYEGEDITTVPVGRLLTMDKPSISTAPKTHNNGSGEIALAPAVLAFKDNRVSVDFLATFPDDYASEASNPKYQDLGDIELYATDGTYTVNFGAVDYQNTTQGNQMGWVMDFDIPPGKTAIKLFRDDKGRFCPI